jgi:hypothetical protein
MTINELHAQFDILLDKASSNSKAEFTTYEVDSFLNIALAEFVKTRYDGNNPRGLGAEESQKRTDDLRYFIVHLSEAPTSFVNDQNTKRYFYPLPSDYWFLLNITAQCTYGNCQYNCNITRIQIDELQRVFNDPFNVPSKFFVLEYEADTNIYILSAPDVTMLNAELIYVKQPYKLQLVPTSTPLPPVFDGSYTTVSAATQDWGIPSNIQQEVLFSAVNTALETIEAQRFQTQTLLKNNQD